MPSRRREEEVTPSEATKGQEEDATPDLLLKYLDTTLATYV
jgi:hypothetical protein